MSDSQSEVDFSSVWLRANPKCLRRTFFPQHHMSSLSSKAAVLAPIPVAGTGADNPLAPLAPGDKTFSLSDLRTHANVKDGPLYMSLLGRVYDVSKGAESFGPSGPYGIFAYHDGTYNLAVMSMKKPTLDKFSYDIDDEDKQTLADWIAYFDYFYGAPVGQLAEKHCIQLSDLPPALKVPFKDFKEEEIREQEAQRAQGVPQSKL